MRQCASAILLHCFGTLTPPPPEWGSSERPDSAHCQRWHCRQPLAPVNLWTCGGPALAGLSPLVHHHVPVWNLRLFYCTYLHNNGAWDNVSIPVGASGPSFIADVSAMCLGLARLPLPLIHWNYYGTLKFAPEGRIPLVLSSIFSPKKCHRFFCIDFWGRNCRPCHRLK